MLVTGLSFYVYLSNCIFSRRFFNSTRNCLVRVANHISSQYILYYLHSNKHLDDNITVTYVFIIFYQYIFVFTISPPPHYMLRITWKTFLRNAPLLGVSEKNGCHSLNFIFDFRYLINLYFPKKQLHAKKLWARFLNFSILKECCSICTKDCICTNANFIFAVYLHG